MIDEVTLVALLDQLDETEARAASLKAENAELRAQVDFLVRASMDAKSLEAEARKPLNAKNLLTVEHAHEAASHSSRGPG